MTPAPTSCHSRRQAAGAEGLDQPAGVGPGDDLVEPLVQLLRGRVDQALAHHPVDERPPPVASGRGKRGGEQEFRFGVGQYLACGIGTPPPSTSWSAVFARRGSPAAEATTVDMVMEQSGRPTARFIPVGLGAVAVRRLGR